MISLLAAQKLVHAFSASMPETEVVPVEESVGRVLAETLVSDQDLPPFDRSTMDGYALRSEDSSVGVRLTVIGTIAAGSTAPRPLAPREAYRIMTGAPVPPGADAVVRLEDSERIGSSVELRVGASAGLNIHPRGQDLRRGAAPLSTGARITLGSLPLLLTFGRSRVSVFQRPSVAVLTSGNELVEPNQTPRDGQIRDSNRHSLAGQVHSAGALPHCLPIARDELAHLQEAIHYGLDRDVLLITGGSSVGDFDFSKAAVESLGAHLWFESVAIKPGKPVLYFTLDRHEIFCLPGNPVSAFVTFELLVRPALERRVGLKDVWPIPMTLPTLEPLAAPKERDLYQVSRLVPHCGAWALRPIHWHGSGDLVSLARANALAHIPAGASIAANQLLRAFPLRRIEDDFPRASEPLA